MQENQSDITSKPGSSGWHIALEKANGAGQYLGDMKVVNHIVRQFLKSVTDRSALVSEGELMPWAAGDADRQACQHMAKVFLGKEPGFAPMGAWNSEGGLGAFLSTEIQQVVAPSERIGDLAVVQAFALITHKVYDILRTVTDENFDAQAHQLNEIAEQFTRSLMGVHTELFEH